jgi:methyl-accepting chemotaxis protein
MRSTEHAAQVKEQAATMREASDAVAAAASRGSEAARAALASMAAIRAASQEAQPLVAELVEKADAIGLVTTTVAGIARQTNLLSLNAAIEAARAGEYGRGFAVVADEVKKLADESGRALNDIRRLAGEVRDTAQRTEQRVTAVGASVADGEEVIHASAEALSDIGGRVEGTLAAVKRIAELAVAQHEQAEALALDIERVSAPAASNAAIAEEVSAVAEQQMASMAHLTQSSQFLADVADRLKAATSRFKLGTATETPVPPTPASGVPLGWVPMPAAGD